MPTMEIHLVPFEDRSREDQEYAVLAVISANPQRFAVIHRVIDGARADSSRALDRTLQRLKRKRLVTWDTKAGWAVAPSCSDCNREHGR